MTVFTSSMKMPNRVKDTLMGNSENKKNHVISSTAGSGVTEGAWSWSVCSASSLKIMCGKYHYIHVYIYIYIHGPYLISEIRKIPNSETHLAPRFSDKGS
jgi:hypothetical protein